MLERAWAEAIPRRDEVVIGRILADDFEGIEPLGAAFSKEEYLADLRSGTFGDQPLVVDEIKARLFGDFAVVTSRISAGNVPRPVAQATSTPSVKGGGFASPHTGRAGK